MQEICQYLKYTGFYNISAGNIIMTLIGCLFIYLAIKKNYEPLLLLPIGFGILIGNVPFPPALTVGIGDKGSFLYYLYFGLKSGIYPPLIFLGIGAMIDFSCLLARPKLFLLGAAAQIGIFITLIGAIAIGTTFPSLGLCNTPENPDYLRRAAAAIGIIGGADGPTAIFLATKLAPDLLGAIAISAYSYMTLVPIIQPPIMYLLTTKKERCIRMSTLKPVSRFQKLLFPIIGVLVCLYIVPATAPLLGMLFFGNLLRESGVTERLARTARNAFIDTVTILLGVAVGASTQAETFLRPQSIAIFVLGAFSFAIATASGVLFAKLMNLFLKDKINPLIGAAGVSAVPNSARVVQMVAQREMPNNYLLMHAMGPNVAGVIGSAVAAGVLLSIFSK